MKMFVAAMMMVALASCSKKNTIAATAPPTDSALRAEKLFQYFCIRCHGDGGYNGKAPNLARFAGDKNAAIEIIKKGAGRMPAFEDRLSSTEIEALADYINNLK